MSQGSREARVVKRTNQTGPFSFKSLIKTSKNSTSFVYLITNTLFFEDTRKVVLQGLLSTGDCNSIFNDTIRNTPDGKS